MVRISLNVEEQKREKIEITSDVYQIPYLSGISKKTIKTSRNGVNLYSLSCSCKVYRQNVKLYPRRDIRRVCKHLYEKLFSEADHLLDELSKMLLHNQFWFGQSNVKKVLFYKRVVFIGFHKVGNIVSFFVDQDGWKKYLYESDLNTWLESSMPFDNDLLNTELANLSKELYRQIKFN
ncbi:MAG: hypothetical protein MUE91_03850 [Ignavibacteriaceae bacterium]|jgi:hypothetical protein|nr:hypothetical protein [Ignavibacteriaceae bacterium]MCU0413527.1 hypothetical protein [Ignavibacteriaceae bacterium]